MTPPLRQRIGRRGAVLLLIGGMWALYGWGLIVEPVPDQRPFTALLHVAPLAAWGWLWIAAGVVAVGTVAVGTARGVLSDVSGYVALIAPPAVWSAASATSWWPLMTYGRGWSSALIWAAVITIILIVAGWPEARGVERRPE